MNYDVLYKYLIIFCTNTLLQLYLIKIVFYVSLLPLDATKNELVLRVAGVGGGFAASILSANSYMFSDSGGSYYKNKDQTSLQKVQR